MKKTVRTRRGVEPTGRPARREVELGKESTNELVIRKLGRSDPTNDAEKGTAPT